MADCEKCKTKAEFCIYCNDGSEFTPQTNADHIRAMSDEELAEFLSHFYECECCEHNNYELCKKCEFEGGGDGILKWLKSEVKE